MMTAPKTFSALKHRNFQLFFFAQLISLIGSWMQNTAQGWLVVLLAAPHLDFANLSQGAHGAAAGRANLYLGIVSAAGSLPILFGALYGGVLADRFSKREIIFRAQFVLMLLAFGMASLIFAGHTQIWQVVVFAASVGLVNIFDIPARQSFVYEMVGKADLANAIALNSALFNAARAFGPALAGVLLALLHNQTESNALAQCFFWNGVSFVGVLIALRLMRGDFAPRSESTASPFGQLREVGSYLKINAPMRLLITLVAAFSVFTVPYYVLLPSIARFTLHTDARQFGLLLSCQGIGALVGALTVATLSEYPRKGAIMGAAGLTFPILMLFLTANRNFTTACFLVTMIGFCIICFIANANTVLQTSAPDNLRGRLMGLYSVLLMGMTPVGSLWASAVAKVYDAPTAIAVGAVVSLSIMVWTFGRYTAFRNMGRALPETL